MDFSRQICNKTPVPGQFAIPMDNRSSTALIALRRIMRVTELNARALANESDLTASQLLVLQQLAEGGSALPSVIARSVGLKQATMTVLVNKLEDAGLVTRRRDTEDRRRVWVEMTEAGRGALAKSPDLLQDRFERGFNALDDWEQSLIITALERVANLLDAEAIEAAPVLDVGDLARLVDSKQEKSR